MKYTYSMSLETTYYTTVTASSEEDANKIATQRFFSFEDIEEGDAEWTDSQELENTEDTEENA